MHAQTKLGLLLGHDQKAKCGVICNFYACNKTILKLYVSNKYVCTYTGIP